VGLLSQKQNYRDRTFSSCTKSRPLRGTGGPDRIRTDDLRRVSWSLSSYELRTADLLKRFEQFCRVDLQQSDRTVKDNIWQMKKFLENQPTEPTVEDLRSYLAKFQDKSPSTRANILKAFKRFFRDFLQRPDLVQTFKFPKRTYTPKTVPSKEDLRRFFDALENDRDRALFLMYATSGLRRTELLGLTVDDIDLENRLIIPKNAHNGATKNTWATCFNVETQTYLRQYLVNRQTNDKRLFPISEVTLRRAYKEANRKTGLHIKPQVLRDWFCCQLGELGIPDRYVDAFCGRTPKSVLARHYTDYSPTKLKAIYDKANLTVLT